MRPARARALPRRLSIRVAARRGVAVRRAFWRGPLQCRLEWTPTFRGLPRNAACPTARPFRTSSQPRDVALLFVSTSRERMFRKRCLCPAPHVAPWGVQNLCYLWDYRRHELVSARRYAQSAPFRMTSRENAKSQPLVSGGGPTQSTCPARRACAIRDRWVRPLVARQRGVCGTRGCGVQAVPLALPRRLDLRQEDQLVRTPWS